MNLFSHYEHFRFILSLQYIMIDEPNGNGIVNMKLSPSATIPIASSTSNDDLSQSLSISEYTDADDSMSAPTEYLAEVNFDGDDSRQHFYVAQFSFFIAFVHLLSLYKLCGKSNSLILEKCHDSEKEKE